MFGYLRVDAKNLRLREYDCYKSLYCGLCKSMGRCTGQCSRLALSYDFTFLAALRLSLAGEAPQRKPFRCAIKCFRKHKAFVSSKELDFCADASAILNHYKLLDDKADETGLKNLRARLGLGLFRRGYRKARRRHPDLDALVKDRMEELSGIEKEKGLASVDRPADCFGRLLGEIASFGLPSPKDRIARAVGLALGKWIYLIDAADDYEEDKKRGRFNPFFAYEEGLDEAEKENLRDSLTEYLYEAERALALVDDFPVPEFEELLKNLLYLGLPKTTLQILFPKKDRKEPT